MVSTRRLAAILAADVVGYSRLMGLDEAGTVAALREHRAAADPLVTQHGGRIVKTTGDGILIDFGSVVGAVECALGLQRLAEERNAGTPAERRMEWRIGVHLGDVLIEGDDILGDGVNIAARPLYVKLELRAITNSQRMRDSAVMISSTMPSAKYSCSGSLLILAKGNTAIDGLSGSGNAAPGLIGCLPAGDEPTQYTRNGRAMFFRLCSPRSANSTSTLPRTWRKASSEM